MKNQSIICFFIVKWQGFYASWFLSFLGCLGYFLCKLKILCWVDMILLWAKNERRFGKQAFCVFFGRCGKPRTTLHSIMRFFRPRSWKREFVCFLCFEFKLIVDDCPLTLVGFFEWLGTCWGSFFNVLVESWWWREVCFLLYFGPLLWRLLFFNVRLYLSKNIKFKILLMWDVAFSFYKIKSFFFFIKGYKCNFWRSISLCSIKYNLIFLF